MLYNSALDLVGNTPLIKLRNITEGIAANLYAKCEFFNPGGSIKDRIALKMIEEAEEKGVIRPGDTLIEPTSGNTGIGLALVGALKGYQVVVTMPAKMSLEKEDILLALGAEIVRTPTEAPWDSPESHIGVAKKMVKEMHRAHILDQYSNTANPRAHYEHTAKEILDDLGGDVDMLVVGAGTGGTLSGLAKRIKESCPDVEVVGVDPYGSILAGGDYVTSYKVEGIGYDFVPNVLDRTIVDRWIKTSDEESFLAARQLIVEEGLLCGGSSGAAIHAALSEAKRLDEGQNCVVILPDGIRNYMSKFLNNQWMEDNGYFKPSEAYELSSNSISSIVAH